MQVKDTLLKTAEFFKAKGIESARLDAELLLAEALGWERIQLYTRFDYPMTEQELSRAREMVRRRGQGEPIAYILQKKDFYKHQFFVGVGVLIPRPETEQIVELGLQWWQGRTKLAADASANDRFRILDLGCGSGCIGLSLLSEIPNSTLTSVDVSVAATDVTTRNARNLNLADRIEVVLGKVEDVLKVGECDQFDLIVANPPYIAANDPLVDKDVRQFEPNEALFADDDGIAAVASWSEIGAKLLSPTGCMLFEIGHDQGVLAQEKIKHGLQLAGLDDFAVTLHQDLAGLDRVVMSRKLAVTSARNK